MALLVLGLLLFVWIHSLRFVAERWRLAQIARFGPMVWAAWHALLSTGALILIVFGYAQTRQAAAALWFPPVWTKVLTIALAALAFVLMVAQFLRRSYIRRALNYPFAAGIALWAGAHLFSNGRLGDVVLFSALLAWSVFIFVAGNKKIKKNADRCGVFARMRQSEYTFILWDVVVFGFGLGLAFFFARYLHGPLIGVIPSV